MPTDCQIAVFHNSIKENYILYSKIPFETRCNKKEKSQQSFHSPTLLMAKCYEGEIAESHVFLAMRRDSHAKHGMEVQGGQGLKFWKVLPHEKTWTRKYYLTLSQVIHSKGRFSNYWDEISLRVTILYGSKIQVLTSLMISLLFYSICVTWVSLLSKK